MPPEIDEHGVVVVERHPGARVDVLADLALRLLRPERHEEIGEAPVGPAGAGIAIGGVGVPQGMSLTWYSGARMVTVWRIG